jgi:glyceraldehyde-3-phosphate dehydrogenase (NADP+)
MKMLINGEWVGKKETIDVVDPYDYKVIDTVPSADEKDVEKAVSLAEIGAKIARDMPIHQRTSILKKVADILEQKREEFAQIIARESSKTIKEARKEAFRCWNTITISAEEAKRVVGETLPFDSVPGTENRKGYWYRMPVGVILAITPFNDPLNLVAHKLGPAITGGNSVVLKPATVTPLSALKLAEAFQEAGLPAGVLNVITGYGDKIGDKLVSDARVRMISFTGGTEAGLHITKIAGLKKIGMELGSNSPTIVMADADFDAAVENCVSGAFWACGQNCIGVQRLYVQKPIYDKFRDAFVARTKKYKVGPKLEEDCDMGPLITKGEAERVESWIEEAKKAGAKLLCGGKRGGPAGTVVEPTVFEGMPATAKLHKDEVFGPVVNLYPFDSLEEAIAQANSLNYGLHAAILTNDIRTAFKAAYQLECGGVIINDSTDYRMDLMPFGGIKMSGLGREGIKFALQEMTEPKVVCFNL